VTYCPAANPSGMRISMCPKFLARSDVVAHLPAWGKGLLWYFPECQSLAKELEVGGSGEM
jgi:hypothetical protein